MRRKRPSCTSGGGGGFQNRFIVYERLVLARVNSLHRAPVVRGRVAEWKTPQAPITQSGRVRQSQADFDLTGSSHQLSSAGTAAEDEERERSSGVPCEARGPKYLSFQRLIPCYKLPGHEDYACDGPLYTRSMTTDTEIRSRGRRVAQYPKCAIQRRHQLGIDYDMI
jgi:hypothetical protein